MPEVAAEATDASTADEASPDEAHTAYADPAADARSADEASPEEAHTADADPAAAEPATAEAAGPQASLTQALAGQASVPEEDAGPGGVLEELFAGDAEAGGGSGATAAPASPDGAIPGSMPGSEASPDQAAAGAASAGGEEARPPLIIGGLTTAARHRAAAASSALAAAPRLRPDDSAPERQRVLDIIMDARMRYWRERVLLMVAALVVFSIVGNWIVGLTLAILSGIAHAVWRSPAIAGVPPGVKLDKAQRLTQRKLARIERAGYRALHARPIPGSEEMIDHLVVGPTGTYAIDSEKWDRRLPIRTRNGKQLWLGPQSKKDRLEHAKWEAERASELLSAQLGREIKVRPALAIYGPQIPWDIAVIRDVDVFNGDRLRRYLKKRSRLREVARLSRDEIAAIHAAAEEVLPFASAPAEQAPVA